MKLYLLICLTLVISSLSHAAVFGADDRVAIRPGSPGAKLARSTAVGILTSLFEPDSESTLKLYNDSLGDYMCSSERFATDPSLPYACSGFLVAPDLLATAGHCMVNFGQTHNQAEMYCQAYAWLFDYSLNEKGQTPLNQVPSDNLYRCKQIIYAVSEDFPPYRDFALVQLDRPVGNRKPLKLAKGTVDKNERFSMIGYPLGSPAKLSRGARLLFNDPARHSFVTNLDAFQGNSGSPVFNKANEVVGILISGTPIESFVQNDALNCDYLNRCNELGTNCLQPGTDSMEEYTGYKGLGSEVQKIGPLRDLLASGPVTFILKHGLKPLPPDANRRSRWPAPPMSMMLPPE